MSAAIRDYQWKVSEANMQNMLARVLMENLKQCFTASFRDGLIEDIQHVVPDVQFVNMQVEGAGILYLTVRVNDIEYRYTVIPSVDHPPRHV